MQRFYRILAIFFSGRWLGFRRNAQGTALIEFAMVAGPIIFLLLFCVEIGIRYLISANMNAGSTAIIRFINSQEASQTSSLSLPSQSQFISTACNDMGYMLPCNGNVLDVEARVKDGLVLFQLVYHWNSIVPNFGYDVIFSNEVRSPILFAAPRGNGVI